jgi:hypothetical protein
VIKLPAGTVVAVLNPRKMDSKPDPNGKQGTTYTIDSEHSISNLGYSRDYDVCNGMSENPTTKVRYCCSHFVNKTVEKECERHQLEAQRLKLIKIKSHRVGCVSDKIDLNEIRRRTQQEIADSCGAFGLPRGLKQDNRPRKLLSKEEVQIQK